MAGHKFQSNLRYDQHTLNLGGLNSKPYFLFSNSSTATAASDLPDNAVWWYVFLVAGLSAVGQDLYTSVHA